MEVILRNNLVESVRAGDRVNFVGTLIVVPDVAAISAPGEKAEARPGACYGWHTRLRLAQDACMHLCTRLKEFCRR